MRRCVFLLILVCLASFLLPGISVFAEVDTAPELPVLSSAPERSSEKKPAASVPAEEEPASHTVSANEEEQNDTLLIYVGIGAWGLFLVILGVAIVLLIRRRKHPPGGGAGGKGSQRSAEAIAYRERLLDDQHYRKY